MESNVGTPQTADVIPNSLKFSVFGYEESCAWGANLFKDLQSFPFLKNSLLYPSVGTFVGMLFHSGA